MAIYSISQIPVSWILAVSNSQSWLNPQIRLLHAMNFLLKIMLCHQSFLAKLSHTGPPVFCHQNPQVCQMPKYLSVPGWRISKNSDRLMGFCPVSLLELRHCLICINSLSQEFSLCWLCSLPDDRLNPLKNFRY